MTKKQKTENKILWISFIAGAFLATSELILAVSTRSQSVLMDGVYDTIELLLVIGTLFLTPLFYRPTTEKRPFGYGQVESVYVIVKGFMMISVTLGLTVNSIQLALSGGNTVDGGIISIFQIVYGLINYIIFLVLSKLNKKMSSPTVDIEIRGWKIDIYYSAGMALAFFSSTLLDGTILSPILPYFDQIIAILIVLFTLPGMVIIVINSCKELFLFAPKHEIVTNIKKESNSILTKYPFEATFFDITKTGRKIWIAIYFEPYGNVISKKDIIKATNEIKEKLNPKYEDFHIELIMDV